MIVLVKPKLSLSLRVERDIWILIPFALGHLSHINSCEDFPVKPPVQFYSDVHSYFKQYQVKLELVFLVKTQSLDGDLIICSMFIKKKVCLQSFFNKFFISVTQG